MRIFRLPSRFGGATPCITVGATCLLLAACGTPTEPINRPEPRQLGRGLEALSAASPWDPSIENRPQIPDVEDPRGQLTLERALAQALTSSPELTAFSYDVRAAEARSIQAGFLPPPSVGLDAQDFGGVRDRRAFDSSQTTLSLSQLVELGDKRARRVRAARLDESLAAWDYETKRLDTFLETTRAFISLLASQHKLALAENALALDRQVHASVVERMRAGRVSPLEERRAQVAVANATVAVDRARREVAGARQQLVMLWGGRSARFDSVVGDLADILPPPSSIDSLVTLAAQNPDLARWDTEIDSREAKLSVERSKDVPDPTFSAGIRRYGDDNSAAFIAGVSFPLPVFGLNQGNVLEAQQRLGKGYAERRAAQVRAETAVKQGYERLASAFESVNALKEDVLPAATTAFEGAREGYRQGKFALIDVLDSQRSLTEAQARLVDGMAEYQIARAELERLVGQPLFSTQQPQSRPGE